MAQLTPAGCFMATVITPSAAGFRLSSATCAVQPLARSTEAASETLPAVMGAR